MFFEEREIAFHHGGGELVGLEEFAMPRSVGNSCGELTQDTHVGINGCFVVPGEAGLLIAQYPLFISCVRKGNDVRWLRHLSSFPP